jgi:16S rRNA (cytosine967-C5)-methyltransferase
MIVNKFLIGETASAFEALSGLPHPADAMLRSFFRERAKLGQRDREFVAETVYAWLRRKRSVEHFAASQDAHSLVLATLARVMGFSLRQLEPFLTKREAEWITDLKSRTMDGESAGMRLDLPDWLVDRLGGDVTAMEAFAQASLKSAPLDLRINPLKTDREAVIARFNAEGIKATATPYSPLGVRLQEKPALAKHPLFLEGAIEVQDEGSQLLCQLVAPKRGEMIADFCAGAGGKTLTLGALMRSTGRLYAFDVSAKRLGQFGPRLKRSGLSNVHAQQIESENDGKLKRLAGKFDRVLVDAPCSGLGTLRRNPDLKWRQSALAVDQLHVKQVSILAAAAKLVKPGGRLIYATCSILDDENGMVVREFLMKHPAFHLLPAGEVMAAQKIDIEMGEYFELSPQVHGTDGFFAAVLELDKGAPAKKPQRPEKDAP